MLATVGGQEHQPAAARPEDRRLRVAQYAGQIPDKTTAPDQYKLFQEDVLDYLITYELVSQKAAALSITVTDQDVREPRWPSYSTPRTAAIRPSSTRPSRSRG